MKTTKKRVPLHTLAVGAWCYPKSARPSGSYLRTAWKVASFRDDGSVMLRLGTAVRFLSNRETVLIDDLPS